jgi:hypothetical protein
VVKVMLMGVAPPTADVPGANGGPAFVGTDSGRRLAKLAGLASDVELVRLFDCVNVFDHPISAIPAGKQMLQAQLAAQEKVISAAPRYVLALGNLPRKALSLSDWWHWAKDPEWLPGVAGASAIPHPSGRTRYWNDAENRTRAAALFEKLTYISREGR